MSSKSRSRSRSASRSPKYSRRGARDDSISPIRTASGANLRTPKNYNNTNRPYNNNNYGYRNYGYNNNQRGYYNNQRGYYPRWNRGRGNWRWPYNNHRNQWNDRRRYSSRSDRSRSKSRSRSYDSRDSASSSDRSKSRSRSRDKKRSNAPNRSEHKTKSRSPVKVSESVKIVDKKTVAKNDDSKSSVTVPSTTEMVTEPAQAEEDAGEDEKQIHFAQTSAFTRSRWETPDGSPGRRGSIETQLKDDEVFDRWDDDKLREYLLKSKGKKLRKEQRKSSDYSEEKSAKKKKKKPKSDVRHKKSSRRSSSHDPSTDSSFSPIHKAPSRPKKTEGDEKYLPPDYDEDDNQSVEMVESPPKPSEPYRNPDKKMNPLETLQYPLGRYQSTTVTPPPKPAPVPPPAPALPAIGEMQVLGPDGRPMRLVPVSIPGPDGNLIQVMQLQPVLDQVAPPKPVDPPIPADPPIPSTAYPPPHQYMKSAGTQNLGLKSGSTDDNIGGAVSRPDPNDWPFSAADHTDNLKKMESQPKQTQKQEVLKTRFKPKPAGSWGVPKKKSPDPPEAPAPVKEPEIKGMSIPNLVNPAGKMSRNEDQFNEQRITTVTGTKPVRMVLEPKRADPLLGWDRDSADLGRQAGFSERKVEKGVETRKFTEFTEKRDQNKMTISRDADKRTITTMQDNKTVTTADNNAKTMRDDNKSSKSVSKEPESSGTDRKNPAALTSDDSDAENPRRKREKKKKKKSKKKQKEDEGGRKKKKKQKEKSVEKIVAVPLEYDSIKSKKDLKAYEELNKKAKPDNLMRDVDENLPISHVRAIVPRDSGVVFKNIFSHIVTDDLASSASYEDRFVSLFGSSSAEPAQETEERIDLTKKSVRKFKVRVQNRRAVEHMTGTPLTERVKKMKIDTEDSEGPKISSEKISVSRSRSRSASSTASSAPPKKAKKKKKKRSRSSTRSSSRSRSRSCSLPAAYDDDKAPGHKYHRDDHRRYSRSGSSSGEDRGRDRRPAYYNRNQYNNSGYYYNQNRGRGFYPPNRGRGWYHNNNRGYYNNNNNRGGYRGRWNNWNNQGWNNRNQNYGGQPQQRFRSDYYPRDRSRSRSRSSSRSRSRTPRRHSRSPGPRSKSPPPPRDVKSPGQAKNTEVKDERGDAGQGGGTGTDSYRGQDIFNEERPPGVD